jgi:predicted transcriptional regulator
MPHTPERLGADLLDLWLRSSGCTQWRLALRLGCTQQAVSNWLRGVSRPNRVTRKAIQRVTECWVPSVAWATDDEAREQPQQYAKAVRSYGLLRARHQVRA